MGPRQHSRGGRKQFSSEEENMRCVADWLTQTLRTMSRAD